MSDRTASVPRIVTIGFAAVLAAVFGSIFAAGRQGQEKDAAAILAFQQTSFISRSSILNCLAQARPARLNLDPPERLDSLFSADDYGTFGPLALRHDDLRNGARHIVARTIDGGTTRTLQVWTRPDVRLLADDVAVLKACLAAT